MSGSVANQVFSCHFGVKHFRPEVPLTTDQIETPCEAMTPDSVCRVWALRSSAPPFDKWTPITSHNVLGLLRHLVLCNLAKRTATLPNLTDAVEKILGSQLFDRPENAQVILDSMHCLIHRDRIWRIIWQVADKHANNSNIVLRLRSVRLDQSKINLRFLEARVKWTIVVDKEVNYDRHECLE